MELEFGRVVASGGFRGRRRGRRESTIRHRAALLTNHSCISLRVAPCGVLEGRVGLSARDIAQQKIGGACLDFNSALLSTAHQAKATRRPPRRRFIRSRYDLQKHHDESSDQLVTVRRDPAPCHLALRSRLRVLLLFQSQIHGIMHHAPDRIPTIVLKEGNSVCEGHLDPDVCSIFKAPRLAYPMQTSFGRSPQPK